jgi:hypothetical protein
MKGLITIMLLSALCGVFCIRAGCAGLPPLPKPVVAAKRYESPRIVKPATQLITRTSSVVAKPTIAIGIQIKVIHDVQFSSDFQNWTSATNYAEPIVWIVLPASETNGFYRDREIWTNGNLIFINVSTNAPTP